MSLTMPNTVNNESRFCSINAGYDSLFKPDRLSVGLVVPLETYITSAVPTMANQLERVQLAEALGFSSVWLRDVPFNVKSFGDAGQCFDPFVYLGYLAAQTSTIALGVSSIVLPLRHPAHVAKAAASVDVLSGGRLMLGIASGDRPDEYPALGIPFGTRGERFRESYDYIRSTAETFSAFENSLGQVTDGMDLLPKPTAGKLPLLVTGSSQQSPDWIASNGDGWMTYPRAAPVQARLIEEFQERAVAAVGFQKPIMEPLYIDLSEDRDAEPQSIHLGLRLGVKELRRYLKSREAIGVNHVALNLRFNQRNLEKTLQELSEEILPEFTH